MNPTSHTELSPDALDVTSSFAFATAGDAVEDRDAPDQGAADLGMGDVDLPPHRDALEFRVLRAGTPARRLRLTGNRYTFGSADGCSIRLSDSAIRPMHAVLIRDARRILVRAYSVPVEVNGRSATETALNVGDVLRIGAYRFELLSTTTEISAIAPALESAETTSASDRVSPVSSEESHLTAARQQLPPAADDVWRDRLRREVSQWRARQAECDRREARCDDRETNLRGRESELWARAEHLYRREAQLQSQEAAAIQIHEDYAQKQAELIDLREETYARQRAYEQRESEFRNLENQFQQQEAAYRKQVEEASRQLRLSQQQAESATEAVHRMREQFLSLNEQIEELSTQQDRFQNGDEVQREDHQRLLRELESARDQANDARAESDALRQQAEARVEEMASQLDALKSEHGSAVEDYQSRLAESESLRERAERRVGDMASQLDSLESDQDSELHEHQSQLAESEARRERAEQRISELSSQLQEFESQQEAEVQSYQERLTESDAQLERAQQRMDELTSQLQELESQRGSEVESYQQRLAESDTELQQAEQRIEALTTQLQELESAQGTDVESYQQRLAESESIAEQLRGEVEQLQQSVSQTREEAEQLRIDYQNACDSIRDLEQSVATDQEKGDADRESWDAEAKQLRDSVEKLSADLENAGNELNELREANETLTQRLTDLRHQNDDLREAAATRPTVEAWDNLRAELEQANQQLASLKQEYDDSLAMLEQAAQPTPTQKAEATGPLPVAWNLAIDVEEPSPSRDDVREPLADAVSDVDAVAVANANADADADADAVADSVAVADAESSADVEPLADAASPDDVTSSASDESFDHRDSIERTARLSDDVTEMLGDRDPSGAADTDSSDASADVAEPASNPWSMAALEPSPWADSEPQSQEPAASDSIWLGESTEVEAAPNKTDWQVDSLDEPVSDEPQEEGVTGDCLTEDQEEVQEVSADTDSPWQSHPIEDDSASGSWQGDSVWNDVANGSEHPIEDTPAEAIQDDSHFAGAADSDEASEFTSPWTPTEQLEPEEDNPWASASPEIELAERNDDRESYSDDSSDPAGGDPADGSLASMLIKDIESDVHEDSKQDTSELVDREFDQDEEEDGTFLMSQEPSAAAWDSERPEEGAFASSLADEDEEVHEGFDLAESNFPDPESLEELPPLEASSDSVAPEQEQDLSSEEIQAVLADTDDDSIEAYMNRLLQRVHGDPARDSLHPDTVSLSTPTETSVIAGLNPGDTDVHLTAPVVPVDPDAPLVPRSEAPEKHSNLSAMRKLANESARSAIDRSSRVHARDMQIKAVTKLGFAAIALGCGGLCLLFIPGVARYLAGAMTIIVAGVCIVEGISLFGEAKKNVKSKGTDDETDMEADFLEPKVPPAPSKTAPPEAQ